MTKEEQFFARKRFILEKLEPFGFQRKKNGYQLATDFMQGDFRAMIFVSQAGKITGQVIDKMNDEEYAPLRAEGFTGGYVNSVRTAYEELLASIANKCCRDVWFASDQANRIADEIGKRYAVFPDFPWKQTPYDACGTFRHSDNGKWFALILHIRRDALLKNGEKETADVLNLKRDPSQEPPGLGKSVFPAYHMNHKAWISVLLDDSLPDREILRLIEKSYDLTCSHSSRKK